MYSCRQLESGSQMSTAALWTNLMGRHLEGITASGIFVLYRNLHWAFNICSMCLYNQDLSEHISMLHSFVQLPNATRPNKM